jgi:hypothetical protein
MKTAKGTLVTLDSLTSENVSTLTTVELIDMAYDHMTRVQAKTMHHFNPTEVLKPAYDEHSPDSYRDCNPRILALDAELMKRFQPMRKSSQLAPQDKARVTRFLKELDLVSLITFTKDQYLNWDTYAINLMSTANKVLALLLESGATPEPKEAFAVVRQKYDEKRRQREQVHRAFMALRSA